MKEIKFRIWAENSEVMVFQKGFNKWVESFFMEVVFDDGQLVALHQHQENYGEKLSIDNPPIYSTDDMVKVMQYTGLKDNHDVEIYEGDILNQTGKDFLIPKWFVVGSIFEYHNMNALASTVDHIGVEIIGNIYENPELLEVKT